MIVPFLAGLLLTFAVQEPSSHGAPDSAGHGNDSPPASEQPGNGGTSEDATEEVEEAAEVCRRVVSYDDFGRQRSRRVCRPR